MSAAIPGGATTALSGFRHLSAQPGREDEYFSRIVRECADGGAHLTEEVVFP